MRIVVFTGAGSIIELWWSNGSWAHSDLGSASGAPTIRLVPLSGYARADDDTQHVFFHGQSSPHINELVWRRSRWQHDIVIPHPVNA